MEIYAQIEKAIEAEIDEVTIELFDPRNDGKHLEAIVVSPRFEGLSLVEKHRLVMNALKKEFSTSLHALSLKTYTPKEWEIKNGNT